MKRFAILLVIAALFAFAGTASADDISFSGGVAITQGGSIGTPAVNFTFTGLSVTPGTLFGDALEGTAVSITPVTAFSFTSIAGSNGLFSPNTGTMSIGNATTGMLTGDITFVSVTGGNGAFAISIGLTNINITTGTSALLSTLAGTNNGTGVFTFQFTAGNAGLSDLLNMGLGSGSLGGTSELRTSVSGSVTVPEPASMFLLGSGMIAGGGFLRRKFQK